VVRRLQLEKLVADDVIDERPRKLQHLARQGEVPGRWDAAPFARSSAKTRTAMFQLPHFVSLPVPSRPARERAKNLPCGPTRPTSPENKIENRHQDRATGRTASLGTMWRADTLPLRLCPMLAAAKPHRTFPCARLALFVLAM